MFLDIHMENCPPLDKLSNTFEQCLFLFNNQFTSWKVSLAGLSIEMFQFLNEYLKLCIFSWTNCQFKFKDLKKTFFSTSIDDSPCAKRMNFSQKWVIISVFAVYVIQAFSYTKHQIKKQIQKLLTIFIVLFRCQLKFGCLYILWHHNIHLNRFQGKVFSWKVNNVKIYIIWKTS